MEWWFLLASLVVVFITSLIVNWITENRINDMEDYFNRRLLELETYVDGLDNLNIHRLNNLEPLVLRLKKELEDMTNLEKYLWVADNYREDNPMCRLCQLRGENCGHYKRCEDCLRETLRWLNKEYEEPQKHYTEIEVMNDDCLTPGQEVLVNDDGSGLPWQTRKFLAYYGGKFYCLDGFNHAFAYDRCKVVKEV